MSYYHAVHARELLAEEARDGYCIPWTGDARELAHYATWLFGLPRSRWPADPSPIGQTAQVVALAAKRLFGGTEALKPDTALRVVLQVATASRRTTATEAA